MNAREFYRAVVKMRHWQRECDKLNSTRNRTFRAEAIEAYRVITGACAMGTRHFCETILGDKKKEKYTVAEVIELTKGQYGAESFKEFFKK